MATAPAVARADERPLAPLRDLFTELSHLKRINSAGRDGSLATRLFLSAWAAVAAGEPPGRMALEVTAAGVAAARLGDLDAALLADATLSAADRRQVLRAAIEEVAAPLDRGLTAALIGHIDPQPRQLSAPAFAALLARQPRAGVTCPGRPRIMLEPPENHAEHSIVVGLYAVLLCPHYRADPGQVMLMALAHHLHNAWMPDSGFTGETLLGAHLQPMMDHFTARALAELPPAVRARVEAARALLPDAATPEGQAFHAADVIDRVLQIESHLATATLTMDTVLGDMELVHDGPVKAFHDRVLSEAGIT